MLAFPRNPKKEKVATPQEERIFTPLTRKVRLVVGLFARRLRRSICRVLVKGFITELLVLSFHSGFRVSRSERMTSEGALLKDSVCVDLFRKFVKASDYPIEGWRLAVKHSVCNGGSPSNIPSAIIFS